MTEPRPSCYRRCPQRTSLSGAFRSLHCLIYKVLAPSASAAERMLSYHAARLLSSSFFNFFRSSFSACRRPSAALSDSSFILPEPLEFVKLFFASLGSFFSACPLAYRRSQTARLFYQSFQSLSSTFFTLLKTFLLSRRHDRRVSDSLLTIPEPSLFVNSFFQVFSGFFKHALSSAVCLRAAALLPRLPLAPEHESHGFPHFLRFTLSIFPIYFY